MPDSILQNEATAALREITVSIADLAGNPKSGISEGTATIKIAKAGGNLVASAATLTEVTGGASGGGYRLRFASGEVDTVGDLHFEITQSGVIQPVYGYIPIVPAARAVEFSNDLAIKASRSGTAQAGGSSTITLDASASSTNDIHKGSIVFIVSGTGAGQAREITGYIGSTKVATVGRAWSTTPDNTSVFQIVAAAVKPGMDDIMEGTHTYGDGMRGSLSILAGKSSGYASGTIKTRDLADSKDRWTFTVDATGRLTAVANDLT